MKKRLTVAFATVLYFSLAGGAGYASWEAFSLGTPQGVAWGVGLGFACWVFLACTTLFPLLFFRQNDGAAKD